MRSATTSRLRAARPGCWGRRRRRGVRRPLHVRPASATGRARPRDEWPVLSDRGCVLLLLTLVALERGGAQTAIAELAREVERGGADVEPPIEVDFRQRSARVAFADGLDLLCAWGVLEHTAGSHQSFARHAQDKDEALLTVDRRRLAKVVADPARAMAATTLAELMDDGDGYAPTPEGERRRRFHRLARRLVEDPAIVLDDLDEDDRQYLLSQRARVEDAVGRATGLAIERRLEGTAVVVDDRGLTDIPFPTNSTTSSSLSCSAIAWPRASRSARRSCAIWSRGCSPRIGPTGGATRTIRARSGRRRAPCSRCWPCAH